MTVKNVWASTLAIVLLGTGMVTSMELNQSVFDRERHRIKYEPAFNSIVQHSCYAAVDDLPLASTVHPPTLKRKSSAKAFFLSLAVPGLGQFYYGSKVKPLLFLSAEVTAWVFHAKWHGQGDDLTAEYEAFNQAHWYRERYETQLLWTYGETNDWLIDAPEITHHLPDAKDQQYYEMTGKYNQFAWGWDDAELDGQPLDSFAPPADPPPRIIDDATTPYSARRFAYERMRDDANNKYDRATRMIFVSLANRLISAFEAYFVTKGRNNKIREAGEDFARLNMKAELKSYYTKSDTPFFTLTYKF